MGQSGLSRLFAELKIKLKTHRIIVFKMMKTKTMFCSANKLSNKNHTKMGWFDWMEWMIQLDGYGF